MPEMRVQIPDDLDFSDLRLARDSDGMVSFDWSPIEKICAISGVDVAIFREAPEDNLAALIDAWYREHLSRGGEQDPVQEDLIAEATAENQFGAGLSHRPGRA
jgi:hypothetical protein